MHVLCTYLLPLTASRLSCLSSDFPQGLLHMQCVPGVAGARGGGCHQGGWSVLREAQRHHRWARGGCSACSCYTWVCTSVVCMCMHAWVCAHTVHPPTLHITSHSSLQHLTVIPRSRRIPRMRTRCQGKHVWAKSHVSVLFWVRSSCNCSSTITASECGPCCHIWACLTGNASKGRTLQIVQLDMNWLQSCLN